MFTYKVTEEVKEEQNELFKLLTSVFTPESSVDEIAGKTGFKKYRTSKGIFSVVSEPDRKECNVYKGKTKIFEIYHRDSESYDICTRGKFLKHLVLNQKDIDYINANIFYFPKYDMKHCFQLMKKDATRILKAYMNMDNKIDNGLVKKGEIEDSSKPHLR